MSELALTWVLIVGLNRENFVLFQLVFVAFDRVAVDFFKLFAIIVVKIVFVILQLNPFGLVLAVLVKDTELRSIF